MCCRKLRHEVQFAILKRPAECDMDDAYVNLKCAAIDEAQILAANECLVKIFEEISEEAVHVDKEEAVRVAKEEAAHLVKEEAVGVDKEEAATFLANEEAAHLAKKANYVAIAVASVVGIAIAELVVGCLYMNRRIAILLNESNFQLNESTRSRRVQNQALQALQARCDSLSNEKEALKAEIDTFKAMVLNAINDDNVARFFTTPELCIEAKQQVDCGVGAVTSSTIDTTSRDVRVTQSINLHGGASVNATTGFSFDGIDSYVSLTPKELGGNAITFALWLKWNRWTGDDQTILEFGDKIGGNAIVLKAASDSFSFSVGQIPMTKHTSGEFKALVNTWVHVAVTVTSSGVVTIYENGILISTETDIGFKPSKKTRAKHYLGQSIQADSKQTFDGHLYSLAIWDGHAMTAEEVTNRYSSGMKPIAQ